MVECFSFMYLRYITLTEGYFCLYSVCFLVFLVPQKLYNFYFIFLKNYWDFDRGHVFDAQIVLVVWKF